MINNTLLFLFGAGVIVVLINNHFKIKTIMANLQELQDAVTKETTVEQSAVALLNGLAEQIKDAGLDQAKLDEVVTNIQSNSQGLADAVSANTQPSIQPSVTPTV